MTPMTFEASDSYDVAILIKQSSFHKGAILASYVLPLEEKGISQGRLIVYPLPYNDKGKAPVAFIKEQLDALVSDCLDNGVKTIYCADAPYFKVLAKLTKAEPNLGYVLPCQYPGYESFNLLLGINHSAVIYNPLNENKLNLSLKALISSLNQEPGQFSIPVLKDARYPITFTEIKAELDHLLSCPAISCDVETFSLDHDKAGIGTIAFAWNDSDGVAFTVDYKAMPECQGQHGKQVYNADVRKLLREFFDAYTGQLSFHRANYDIKILIYSLYMHALDDTQGLLVGLERLTRDFDDTRIISYLALNQCAETSLSLKDLSQEYAGNYAQDDIKDIRRIDLANLLQYNLVDACCTNWVHDKYYQKMADDQQDVIYFDVMLPSLKTIIQMELTGMPLNPQRVQEVKHQLEVIRTSHLVKIRQHPALGMLQSMLTKAAYDIDYEKRVAKAKHPEKIRKKDPKTFPRVVFNPNSPKQLQVLLYTILKLPVIEKTKTGQAATGAEVLDNLVNHTNNNNDIELLNALIGYAGAEKILSTFITAFERAIAHNPNDPRVYIHGSFNLGGTVSGRLSSSDPNLQNIPSTSQYSKLVKSCFQAPADKLFVGADFNSLEAMVNALTTKDPNKLAVYENNLDSHSWNTFGYWPDKMPDVADRMAKATLPGKFYKRELADGTFEYLHESEL